MKRSLMLAFLALLLGCALIAMAERPGETITIAFEITDNTQKAISARLGMEFDKDVFEFVSAEVVSGQVLNTAPTTEKGKFGLLNMDGITTGEICKITLRIKDTAREGEYEIKPVADSVYNANHETVELTVKGATIVINHVWDDGRITVEPTCYTEGVMTYYCFYCDEQRTESIPVTQHCEGAPIVTRQATCIEEGEQIYPCDICHDTLRTEPLPAQGHEEGDTVVTKDATCNQEGIQVTQCANCGKTIYSESIPATGMHTEVIDVVIAATCTASGLTEGKHCSVCNTVITAQTTIPAKGHTEVIDKAVAATCTAAGKTEGKHCSVCNTVTVEQTTVPAKGHTEVIDKAVAATCTASGLTEGKHCSVCNTVITAQTTVPAKGHIEVVDAAVAATCTTPGKTEGKHCSICGTVIVKQNEVTALGHSWDGGVISKEPTTEEEGVKTFTCVACKTTRTQSVPKLEIVRMPGDADDNKSVNILDALLTLQHSVGWNVPINTSNADVNANGAVDILDALLILQHSVGWNVDLQ